LSAELTKTYSLECFFGEEEKNKHLFYIIYSLYFNDGTVLDIQACISPFLPPMLPYDYRYLVMIAAFSLSTIRDRIYT